MDFGFSDERTMLQDTLRRFLSDKYSQKVRGQSIESMQGFSPDIWSGLAELGVIGALFGEVDGGFGGEGFDIVTVFEELGRAGVIAPFLETAILAGGLIADLGTNEQKSILDDIISGRTQLAFAHNEPQSRYDLSDVTALAMQKAGQFIINGHKSVVGNGQIADTLVVSARTNLQGNQAEGISLFIIPADTTGITRRDYPITSGGRAAEITFKDVHIPLQALLGEEGKAYDAIEKRVAYGITALSAEAVGAMEFAKDMTVEYLQTRKQFGRPIGKFQVLQHRMADVLIEIEQARSSVINIAGSLQSERKTRERMASATKNLIGRAGRLVSEECIQMHGGIGMSQEYELSHFAKRLIMIDHILGDTDHHLERFIALSN